MGMYDVPSGYETKMKIVKAMVGLAKEAPLDSMTIGEICEWAGISRQTFYNHFSDKYDACGWYNEQICAEFRDNGFETMTWHESGERLIERIYSERDFCALSLPAPDAYYSPAAVVRNAQRQSWRTRLEACEGIEITPTLEFQIEAMSYLCTMMTFNWLREGCATPAHEFYKNVESCFPAEFREALDLADKQEKPLYP